MRRKSSGKPEGIEKLFAAISLPDQVPGSITEEMIRLANLSQADCIHLVSLLQGGLRKYRPNWTWISVLIFEECVFNCKLSFHAYVATTSIPEMLYDLLKGRRKKLGLSKFLLSKDEHAEMRLIEDKTLFLVQKLADTFMFHEDRYPAYMKVYKKLRGEGVQFPERDPENFALNIPGLKSPLQDMVLNTEDDDETDDSVSPSSAISPKEMKLLESSLKRLESITQAAEELSDFTNQFSLDLVNTCKTLRRKLSRYISLTEQRGAKSGRDRVPVDDMLLVVQYANNTIEKYENRYAELDRAHETPLTERSNVRGGGRAAAASKLERNSRKSPLDSMNQARTKSGNFTARNLSARVKKLEPPPTSRGGSLQTHSTNRVNHTVQSTITNGASKTTVPESVNLLDLQVTSR